MNNKGEKKGGDYADKRKQRKKVDHLKEGTTKNISIVKIGPTPGRETTDSLLKTKKVAN